MQDYGRKSSSQKGPRKRGKRRQRKKKLSTHAFLLLTHFLIKPKSGSDSRLDNSESYSRPNSSLLNSRLSHWVLKDDRQRDQSATVRCKNDILRDGGSWCRAVAVAVSTSEHVSGISNHAHAAEGFTFVEFLIKPTLEESSLTLCLLLWVLKKGYIRKIGNQRERKTYSEVARAGLRWWIPSEHISGSPHHAHAAEGFRSISSETLTISNT